MSERGTKRGSLATLATSIVGALLCLGLLALAVFPSAFGTLTAEVADGEQSFEIGNGLHVTPDEGWTVQPAWYLGAVLRSPDRVLEVTVLPLWHETEEEFSEDAATVYAEVLENGATLRHFESEGVITAMLTTDSGRVLVEASTRGGADLAEYRYELAELLLLVH